MRESFNIEEHWLRGVNRCQSPNFDDRPACTIDTVVIHNISLPPGQFGGCHVESLFTNTLDPSLHPYFEEICNLEVSAHVFIDRNAAVTQFVAFNKRAWHAGKSKFNGRERFNDFSIGIELEGADDVAFEMPQYQCLARLVATLMKTYPGINSDHIHGHSTISPGRKTDPGPAFDWHTFHKLLAGLQE